MASVQLVERLGWSQRSSTAPIVEVSALEEDDTRRIAVKVAGAAALMVAKVHKIEDRLKTPSRLTDKDSGDVVRLFMSSDPSEISARLVQLLSDDRSASVTRFAIERLESLFGTPRSPGTQMAVRAFEGVLTSETIEAICSGFVTELRRHLAEAGVG